MNREKYPPDWEDRTKRILKRANNKCERCGLENGQFVYSIKLNVRTSDGRYKKRSLWFRDIQDAQREAMGNNIKMVKVVLTTAHLDHDEKNHEVSDDRLMAMCQLCHLRYDAKEKFKRKLKF